MSQEQKKFTTDDLSSVIIADGITAKDATDEQFCKWADSLVAFEISEKPEPPWSLQERANLCNMFYKTGVIQL